MVAQSIMKVQDGVGEADFDRPGIYMRTYICVYMYICVNIYICVCVCFMHR